MENLTDLEKRFADVYTKWHPEADRTTVVGLLRSGLIDYKTCKIAVVKHYVNDCINRGCKKTDAMYLVADDMNCSYKTVEYYMYYYKDINI